MAYPAMRIAMILCCAGVPALLQAQALPASDVIRASDPKVDAAWFGENQNLPALEALKRPVLEGGSRSFKGWTFSQGHATYTLSGRAAYFKTDGVIRGFYFQGDGEVVYTSSDPVEFPAMRYALKRHSFVKPQVAGDALRLQERVYEGLFWFAGVAVPQIPGSEAEGLFGPFTSRLREDIDQDQNAFLQDLSLRVLKTTDRPYFRAQLTGARRTWVQAVDPLDWETLSVGLSRSRDWGYQRPLVLVSRQSPEWSHKVPKPPRFVLTQVALDLEVDQGTQARLKVTETIVPRLDGLTALDLKLRNRMRGLDLLGKEIVQRIRVKSVKDQLGNPVAFDHAYDGLLVALPGLKKNVPVTLTFELEGDLLPYRYFGNSWEGWTLASGAWFPMPLDDAARVYTVKARVRVPKKFNVLMGGETTRRLEGERALVEASLDRPVRDFSIVAKMLTMHEEKRGKVMLRTLGYGLEADNPRLRDRTAAVLEFYERLLGPYPFPELNTILGGSEGSLSPGIISVGSQAQLATEDNINAGGLGGSISFDITSVERATQGIYSIEEIAKAVGHQYWGQVVKPWHLEDAWIPEAFSQYCAALAVRRNTDQGQGDFGLAMEEQYRQAALLPEALPMALTYRVVPVDEDAIEARWQGYLATSRGACLLHRLNQEVGDEAFAEFMRTCLSMASFQPLTTSQMPMILQAVTGKDQGALFDQYFWGTAMPVRKP